MANPVTNSLVKAEAMVRDRVDVHSPCFVLSNGGVHCHVAYVVLGGGGRRGECVQLLLSVNAICAPRTPCRASHLPYPSWS